MTNSVSINDKLGPGGLDSVAIITTNTDGSVSLTGPSNEPLMVTRGEVTLKRTATLSIANNTATYVPFDTLVENTTGLPDLSFYDPTNPAMGDTALFVPAGITRVKFTANIGIPNAGVTAGSIRLTIKQNQTTIPITPAYHNHYVPPATDTTGHIGITSSWVDCVAGDYFEMNVRHVFGGSVDFANGLACYMQAEFR
jgi:hypothetical protein